MSIRAIGIFAGGGAKGIAHVGAYSAALRSGVQFKFFAGTSAGSIVAALISAGYTSNEIYNPETNDGLLATDFIGILGPYRWRAISTFSSGGIIALLWRLWLWPAVICVVWEFFWHRGIFNSTKLQTTFEKWLRKKVTPSDGQYVSFKDLHNLKIVGTSLKSKSAIVWSAADTPDFSVAKAITASIAIPFLFRPVIVPFIGSVGREKKLKFQVMDVVVDGGMLSNFPIWVFDDERGQDWDLSTFAFCFASHTKESGDSWKSYLWRLLSVSISGDSILETRQVDNLVLVPIDVSVGTLDFDANDTQKKTLFNEGADCVNRSFKNFICPQDPEMVSNLLEALCRELSSLIKLTLPPGKLRANVMLKGPRKTFRVVYSYNMNTEADDRLAIREGSGVCGIAIRMSKPAVIDLKTDHPFSDDGGWGLSKYQQAMLWSDLRTIFTIPLIVNQPGNEPEVVGTLNFDSDLAIKNDLKSHINTFGNFAANKVTTMLFRMEMLGGEK